MLLSIILELLLMAYTECQLDQPATRYVGFWLDMLYICVCVCGGGAVVMEGICHIKEKLLAIHTSPYVLLGTALPFPQLSIS